MQKIIRTLIYSYLRSVHKNQFGRISIPNVVKKTKKALFIIPEDPLAVSTIKSFTKFLGRKFSSITYLVDMKYVGQIKDSLPLKVILYDLNSKNKFGLPKKELLNRLRIESFDLIVDLNLTDSLFHNYVIHKLNSSTKIGFYRKNSDLFNNLQLKVSTKENLQEVYAGFFKFLFI